MYSWWKLQRRPVPPSFAPPFSYFSSWRVIFTHRAIHSRLTTGGVTVLPSFHLVLFLFPSLSFSSPSRSSRRSLSCDADILALPHVEERWSFLSRAGRTGRRSQGRSLRVFQIVVLHDGQLPIAVLVSPASSEASERRVERRQGNSVDVISADKKSHNYSTATLRRRYWMWDTCRDIVRPTIEY